MYRNRMRFPRRAQCAGLALTLAVVAALVLAPAAAQAEALAISLVPEIAKVVHLAAPQDGSRLQAGTLAELEWAPVGRADLGNLGGLGDLDRAEEWEAFLSIDGGVTYPIRITPHLDRDLRRVLWEVPALPTRDARLLLRFGDERREFAVVLPHRFEITLAPGVSHMVPDLLDRANPALERVSHPGEPALSGHAGVVAWAVGSREGGPVRTVVAIPPVWMRGGAPEPELHAGGAPDAYAVPASPAVAPRPGPRPDLPLRPHPRSVANHPKVLLAADLLLLHERRNE
jgi:hypothetical protein